MKGPPLTRLRGELTNLRAYRVPEAPPPIKLDANESPWPLSADGRRRLGEHLATLDFHRYPDGRAEVLRDALGARLGCAGDELVLGVGSDEVIAMLLGALSGGAGTPSVVYPTPTFVMYGHTALAHGVRPIGVPLAENWQLDVEAMGDAIQAHRPALAFYATPNNPTGNAFAEGALRTLIEDFPDTLHVIDEAYGAFDRPSPEATPRWRHGWVERYPNAIGLGTLSKIGLAAFRVGWMRAHPSLVAEIEKVRQPFNLNALGIEGAAFALGELSSELEAGIQKVVRERRKLSEALTALGLHPAPSEANFVLVPMPNATRVREALWDEGIAIRVFRDPRLHDHARITVGTPRENRALCDALRLLLRV